MLKNTSLFAISPGFELDFGSEEKRDPSKNIFPRIPNGLINVGQLNRKKKTKK